MSDEHIHVFLQKKNLKTYIVICYLFNTSQGWGMEYIM